MLLLEKNQERSQGSFLRRLINFVVTSIFPPFFLSSVPVFSYPFSLSFCFLSYLQLHPITFFQLYLPIYFYIIFTFNILFSFYSSLFVSFFLSLLLFLYMSTLLVFILLFFLLFSLPAYLLFSVFLLFFSISTSLFFIGLFISLHVVLFSQFLFHFFLILFVTYMMYPLQTDFFFLTSISYLNSFYITWGGHLLPEQDLDDISVPFQIYLIQATATRV